MVEAKLLRKKLKNGLIVDKWDLVTIIEKQQAEIEVLKEHKQHYDQWLKNGVYFTTQEYKDLVRRQSTHPVKETAWDDSRADEIVSGLYRKFEEWSLRKFSADDVTWCEVKAEINKLIDLKTNPVKELTDDGDAFRLAVKLKIEVYHGNDEGDAVYAGYHTPSDAGVKYCIEYYDDITHMGDACSATRRAIVRAATEIEKTNPLRKASEK